MFYSFYWLASWRKFWAWLLRNFFFIYYCRCLNCLRSLKRSPCLWRWDLLLSLCCCWILSYYFCNCLLLSIRSCRALLSCSSLTWSGTFLLRFLFFFIFGFFFRMTFRINRFSSISCNLNDATINQCRRRLSISATEKTFYLL